MAARSSFTFAIRAPTSKTGLSPAPIPKIARPPEISLMVAIAFAFTAG
jgi:hypothetical protein